MSDFSEKQYYLYIFMNLEYDSNGRGRCAAQASHAANQFTYDHIIHPLANNGTPTPEAVVWQKSAAGFGTTIVKACRNAGELRFLVEQMVDDEIVAALVIDPEYVIPDGESIHIIPNVVTCAYVFGDKDILAEKLYQYPLLLNDQVDRSIQFIA